MFFMASESGKNEKNEYICSGGMFKNTAINRKHISKEILTALLF